LRSSCSAVLSALLVCAGACWAQTEIRAPHVGYLYPAGGQRETTVQVIAGGQFLRGINAAYVSGAGVRASVARLSGPPSPFNKELLEEVARHFAEAAEKRVAELPADQQASAQTLGVLRRRVPPRAPDAKPLKLPDHPLLRDLDSKTLPELVELARWFFSPRNLQPPQRAIAETVLLEVSIDASAALGQREIRLAGPMGLSNPLRFEVGSAPELLESEPNDRPGSRQVAAEPAFALNGQVLAGDADRIRFPARQGQRLVMELHARRLMPYLADAVPGWFQAVLALRDPKGTEVAFCDDNGFDPDPLLVYEVPADGEYEVEVRDALYRGREDFVYRLVVGEPVADGERADSVAMARAAGDLPECVEVEPNDGPDSAQGVSLAVSVSGQIERPGDVDVYRFAGRAGETIIAEVRARRLGSDLDSLVRLIDGSGAVVAWNDDSPDAEAGLITHHADSYVRAELPADGTYFVRLSDVRQHGGERHEYRLRLSAPRPDFGLRVTPSSLSIPAGRSAAVTVHVIRKDGFAGEVAISLVDAPAGYALAGGRVPAGRDSIRMTVTAPRQPLGKPVSLRLQGTAAIDGRMVTHEAVPAEDMMQAFAYRHLVPSQELLALTTGLGARAPALSWAEAGPVLVPVGGNARVRVIAPGGQLLSRVKLSLVDPPAGLVLDGVEQVPGGLVLALSAGAESLKAGYSDNLIVAVHTEFEAKPQAGKAAVTRRTAVGVLPALPFEIVAPGQPAPAPDVSGQATRSKWRR